MRVITIRKFSEGWGGRFANRCITYAAARAYGNKFNATIQVNPWIGQKVFKIQDQPIENYNLPRCNCDRIPWGEINFDWHALGQHQRYLDLMTRTWLRNKLFVFQDRWVNKFIKPYPFYVACHIRHGDYNGLNSIYAVIQKSAYERAIEQLGLDIHKIVWVSEETQQYDHELAAEGLEFLPDFMTLVNADIILRANSTFSWLAAALSNSNTIYSPVVGDKTGKRNDIEFVKGNHQRFHMVELYQPTTYYAGQFSELNLNE